MAAAALRVIGLRTHFFTHEAVNKAVDGASFDVRQAETVALVGESGSGKSVSALSIMRLLPQHAKVVGGQVLFNGEDLLRLPEDRMRLVRGRHIGMVFQEPMTSLNPVLRIGEQIAEPLQVRLGMDGAAAHRRTLELLDMVGIREPERRYRDYPHQFSGGMRQRVMIAMALSCGPEMLIADEPTTALDVTTQAQILDTMTGLARRMSTAVLLITHNLGIVARYADRINIMLAGRVVESGTSEEIFSHPRHDYTIKLLGCVPRLDRVRTLLDAPGTAGGRGERG